MQELVLPFHNTKHIILTLFQDYIKTINTFAYNTYVADFCLSYDEKIGLNNEKSVIKHV